MVLPKPTQKQLMQPTSTLEKFDLVDDAWRVSNPDILRYTWCRRRPEIHSLSIRVFPSEPESNV